MRWCKFLFLLIAVNLISYIATAQPLAHDAALSGSMSFRPHTNGDVVNDYGGAQASNEEATKAPVHVGQPGQTYRHPVGFSFWYPADWTMTELDAALQLTPPNPGKTAEGPTELYFVSGESIAGEGISEPGDPRVGAYLDEQIRSFSPLLSRSGEPSPINMSQGKGAVFEWEGKSPHGDAVRARVFVCIIKDHGVALTAIGFKDRLDARDRDLRRMFGSFGFGEGQNDPTLCGAWTLISTYSVMNESVWESDWSRAQAVSETKSRLEIRPDGTWTRIDKHHMIAGAGDVWLESKDESSAQGKWNAGDGLLFMVWTDNSYEDYKYRVQQADGGRQLRLVTGKKGELWQETE